MSQNNPGNPTNTSGKQSGQSRAQNQGGNQNDLAGEAKEAIDHVSKRVKKGAAEAVDEVRHQAESTMREQQRLVANKLGKVCDVIRDSADRMRQEDAPVFAGLMEQAAERIDSFSEFIREREITDMMDGAQDWIRRNPAIFLGGSFVVGMVLARVIKAAAGGMSESSSYQMGGGQSFGRSQGGYGGQSGYRPNPGQSRFSQQGSSQYGGSSYSSTPTSGGLERGVSGSSPSWEEA